MPEQRVTQFFSSVKLPETPASLEFDQFECCERLLVLADSSDDVSYKNDITSAWIKLASISDTYSFNLTKDGVATTYTPTPKAFVKENNAFYITIPWREVLATDGIGCYKLEVEYSIGGITGSVLWGEYNLQEFSLDNANTTCRLKVVLNLKQEIEGIDFTDSNVVDTIRINGFIGNRQPNMEVDNLTYSDRKIKSVVRENLYTYELATDPYKNDVISKLTDLYLLSENEMFISDYNFHNHSHQILDVPVIVNESPEIDYLEKYQRRAVLTALLGDKNVNKRTFY
jgi:hypothetical protein